MRRYDVIEAIAAAADAGTPIVCNIGDPCKELYAIADRRTNFYMLGSLGLASSIGLGLALARQGRSRDKVIVIDGDGGVLMNMGSLATIGRYRPGNLVLVIVDNGAYGSTGDQPTATSVRCDLAGVAKGCSIERAETVGEPAGFVESLQEALASGATSVIVAKVSTEKPPTAIVPLTGPEIRDRFMEVLREQERSGD